MGRPRTGPADRCGADKAARFLQLCDAFDIPVLSLIDTPGNMVGPEAAGSFDETFFSISWPTGEFAGMGLEGAVKLGRRAELQAITDLALRKARYDKMVADAYAWSKALNAATVFEVDDVIDPADTRRWLVMGLDSVPPPAPRAGKKRAWIDTW